MRLAAPAVAHLPDQSKTTVFQMMAAADYGLPDMLIVNTYLYMLLARAYLHG